MYVGWPFEVPEDQRDYSVAGRWRAPANLHIGAWPRPKLLCGAVGPAPRCAHSCVTQLREASGHWKQHAARSGPRLRALHAAPAGIMGLAPAVGVPVSSAAPMRTGGNMDQLRLTKGASLYLPVEVGRVWFYIGQLAQMVPK